VLPCSQIIALCAARPAALHVVEPIFDGDHAFGFFVARGALFDHETLDELGGLAGTNSLARRVAIWLGASCWVARAPHSSRAAAPSGTAGHA